MTPRDLGVEALGVACTVGCRDDELRAAIEHLWSPFPVPASSAPAGFAVTGSDPGWIVAGPAGSTRAEGRSGALTGLATALNAHVLGATPYFAAHAAVLTLGAGAVAFLADSGTGKSTLAAALVQRGCGYVSDEALCLDDAAAVVAYPRPLALLPWSRTTLGLRPRWEETEETLLQAEDLGGSVVTAPPALSHVVLLDRGVDGEPDLRPLSRQRAAAELLRHSFNHWRAPATAFRLAHAAAAGAAAWAMTLGAPGVSADVVLRALGGPA